MEILLYNNIFEFHDGYWRQNVGAAMGCKPVPDYANVFMETIDQIIEQLEGAEDLLLLLRFLDDYFSIYQGSTKELHALFARINKINPAIQLTMSHTSILNEPNQEKCDCEERTWIPYLDVSCRIKEGRIETDLYRKDTDKNQYLLPSSCHPKQTTKSIPFSLGLRIVRVCSNPEDRDRRMLELRDRLLVRNYPRELVEAALDKAKSISRKRALKKVTNKKKNERPVLAVSYDPRLPSLQSSIAKHWRSMTQDSYLKEVFKEPPL
jgi:hypothetical protein